jgi:hypothetical protein
MDEKIIAEAAAVVEALEELDVLGGDGFADDRERFLVGQAGELRSIDAVAFEAFLATERAPFRDQVRFPGEDSKKHFLVVAEQEHGFYRGPPIGAQAFDDLCRIRTAIDQVADEDEEHLARGTAANVVVDLVERLVEKVESTMNVPHRIGAPPAGARRAAVTSGSEVEHRRPLARLRSRTRTSKADQ